MRIIKVPVELSVVIPDQLEHLSDRSMAAALLQHIVATHSVLLMAHTTSAPVPSSLYEVIAESEAGTVIDVFTSNGETFATVI